MFNKLILLVSLIISINCSARTIFVPEEYPNLQDAINIAVDGDTILIAVGTYTGPFSVSKSINIIGQGEETILKIGPYMFSTALAILQTSFVLVKNLKIESQGQTSALLISLSQQINIENVICKGSGGGLWSWSCIEGQPGIIINNSTGISLKNVVSKGGEGGRGTSGSGGICCICSGGDGIVIKDQSTVFVDSSEFIAGPGAEYGTLQADSGFAITLIDSSQAIINNSNLSNTYNVDSTSSITIYNTFILGVSSEQKSFIYSLSQNFPNPFNPSTVISFQLPVSGNVILKVYDVLGNEVATLVDEYKNAGSYEVEFKANNLSSGTYFYQLKTDDYLETKKIMLLK
jgi:hypothetical protein